uniref:Retroviral nucleocapsid Gag protein p24 C-terminal domain-containing protein n=1 Tax=Zonotrichia albicollis TaxID=44394 RepID=A0A8D2QGY0_ZONAL
MGSKLSIVQRGVYYDIVSILIKSNVKFSKGKLKQFIRWLFLQFPNISPEEIHNIQFWDKVGNELITLGQSGKLSSAKLVFWSLQIRTALLKQKEMEKKPNVKPCASALPVPPSPSKTPKPLSPKKPRARVSFPESSDVQNGPQSLGGPQNGGCHVASSQTWSSSSQNPLKHPKIPAPSPSPPAPRDTFPPHPAPCQPLDPAPCSHGFPAPCRLPVPAPSPGSHGGDTPTACPQTCSCDPNASDSRDTEQGTADPMHSAMLSLAPVTFQPAAQAGAAPTANWSSFGRQLIKEICKSHKEYGPHSPYFRGLLNSELSRTIVVPHDLKQLFSCLMTSTEFKLWESALKQLLKDALPSLQADPNTAKDNNGNPITIDHLCGEGQWSSPSVQAAAIPAETLEKVKEAAEKAFFSLQPEGPFEPYSKIKQLPSEPFVKFVERLTRAIEIQVKKENAREAILEEIVFTNANEQCRAAILSLPMEPSPTLKDMLLVCNRKVPLMSVAEDTRPRLLPRPPQRVAVASPAPFPSAQQYPGQQRRPAMVEPTKPCLLCNKLGHWSNQCPLKKEFDEFKNSKG